MGPDDLVLTAAVAVAALAVTWALLGIQAAIRHIIEGDLLSLVEAVENVGEALPAAQRLEGIEARQAELVEELVRLDTVCDSLPVRWEEMYAKVRRTEERARGSVRRALEELEEAGLRSGELEGTLEELRREYGTGGENGGVQQVSEGMGNVPPESGSPSLIDLRNQRVFG